MTSSGDPDGTAEQGVRASDAERHAVVERLEAAAAEGRLDPEELRTRTGAAYDARTLADLAALTADLPRVEGLAVRPAGPPAVPSAAPDSAPPVVAVFGGAERRGRRQPAERESALAVFGGVVLDYREAEPFPPVLQLRATAVFGGIDVVLPEGATVEMTGFALFGGRSAKVAPAAPGASPGPVVRLRAVAVFGGVAVRSARPGE
ncbi:DUF1707 SHOCT-like domain-containing protein [Blastococcus sp. SYSU D00695]